MQAPDPRYFEQCENEPLQFSGAIQRHGSLLLANRQYCITHVSENLSQYLPGEAKEWIGNELPVDLKALAEDAELKAGRRVVYYKMLEPFLLPVDIVFTVTPDENLLYEFFPFKAYRHASTHAPLKTQFADRQAMQEGHDELVEKVRSILGSTRVMFYRFREDGDGEVVAESRQDASIGSYLGLRYPGTDIPLNARTLYLKNPYRLISDAQADPAAILGNSTMPPNLTCSDLRSASPFHRVYMGNMGVRASLSYPVSVAKELYALVTAHHDEPVTPVLAAIEEAGELVRNHALSVTHYLASERMRLVDGLSRHFHNVYLLSQNLQQNWPEIGRVLMDEFAADGAMLVEESVLAQIGTTLEAEALYAVERHLRSQPGELVWQCDSLNHCIAEFPFSQVAGALVIRAPKRGEAERKILLTRTEFLQEVAWGGNPNKPVEVLDGVWNISPRRSFEKWVERKIGYSRSWSSETKLLGFKVRELLQIGAL